MNSEVYLFLSDFFALMGWTILHSLWQIAVLTIVLKLALKITKSTDAHLRYGLALGALFLSLGWSIFTFFNYWQDHASTLVVSEINLSETAPNSDLVTIVDIPVTIPFEQNSIQQVVHFLEPMLPIIAVVWLLGILFFASRMVLGWQQLQGLSYRHRQVIPKFWLQKFKELKLLAGVHLPVIIRFSNEVATPMTYGIIRPVLLFPASLLSGLTPQQIEVLLLHELAHIKRQDFFFNLIQSLIEVVFFYHPFIWWISSIVRAEREHCCDDLVLRWRNQPMLYAQTLTQLQSQHFSHQTKLAMSANGNKGVFTQRIQRLFHTNSSTNLHRYAALLILFALASLTMAFLPLQQKVMSTSHEVKHLVVTDSIPCMSEHFSLADKKMSVFILDDATPVTTEMGMTVDEFLGQQQVDKTNVNTVMVLKNPALIERYGQLADKGVAFLYTADGPSEGERLVEDYMDDISLEEGMEGNKKRKIIRIEKDGENLDEISDIDIEEMIDGEVHKIITIKESGEMGELDKEEIRRIDVEYFGDESKTDKKHKIIRIKKGEEIEEIDLGDVEEIDITDDGNGEQKKVVRIRKSKADSSPSEMAMHVFGDKDVLVIIDGEEQVDGKEALKNLDAERIATIDVLGGDKAVEKYGEAAKDGMITIRTQDPNQASSSSKKRIIIKEVEIEKDEEKTNELSTPQLKETTPTSTESSLKIYPNPTDAVTNIEVELIERGTVEIQVFNNTGQLVKTLANETLDAGNYQFRWDASQLAVGNYFIQFNLNGKMMSKQLSKIER